LSNMDTLRLCAPGAYLNCAGVRLVAKICAGVVYLNKEDYSER
jgi:hypothetical protein